MDSTKVIHKFDVAACAVGKARGATFIPCSNVGVQLKETESLLKDAAAKIDAAGMELRAWRLGQLSKQKQF